MKSSVIHFMRHGEVDNPKQVLYARLPGFGITPAARNLVADRVAEFLPQHIAYIYSSPLLRTRQTAAVLARGLAVKVRYSSRLIEIGSIYAGVSLEEYYRSIQYRMYEQESIDRGHETIESVRKRMLLFVHTLLRQHQGETGIVISHADPILILKTAMMNIPFTWEWKKAHYLSPAHYLTLRVHGTRYQWS